MSNVPLWLRVIDLTTVIIFSILIGLEFKSGAIGAVTFYALKTLDGIYYAVRDLEKES